MKELSIFQIIIIGLPVSMMIFWLMFIVSEKRKNWSECNDCFDGFHEECSGGGCECKHNLD